MRAIGNPRCKAARSARRLGCGGVLDQASHRDHAHRGGIGEVAGLDVTSATFLMDTCGDTFQRLAPAAGQHHRSALLGQHQRRRLADAAAGAGDPGDFPLQMRHDPSPEPAFGAG